MVSGFQARSYEAKDMTTESTITRRGEPVGAELCELCEGTGGTHEPSSVRKGSKLTVRSRLSKWPLTALS
jgi:hypothetical protein